MPQAPSCTCQLSVIRGRLPASLFPYIAHVECLEQHAENICGFCAFYNLTCFLRVLLSPDPGTQIKYLTKMHNRFS